ncbi:MAG: hypothetical protein KC457_17500, partial [Myxococcales bacterium]|nr:hypothetical protein [Myxococcales bacterium]
MGTNKFGTHLEHLWAVAGSRSGRLIAVAGERDAESVDRSQVHVYTKSKLEAAVGGFEVAGAIKALDFAAGDLLLAGGSAGELHGFEIGETGKAVLKQANGDAEITAIASDGKGETVAVVDESGHLTVYALESGE